MTYHTGKKALFLHIPRTGGSSTKKVLRDNGFEEWAVHADHKMAKNRLGDMWGKYFKFSIVRNPYSRMVSWFNYLKHMSKLGRDSKGRKVLDPGDFKNFLLNHKRIYKGLDIDDYSFQKQMVEFIGHDMDFIIRFENLQADFDALCDKIEIPRTKLPVKKRTKAVDYKSHYNDYLKGVVFNIFKDDFKKFNYEF